MEYACHVWGGSTHIALLDRVESKAFRLIRSPPLTSCLVPLNSRHSVASLSISYRYFHAYCSSDLANHATHPPTASLYTSFFTSSPLYCPILSKPFIQEWTSTFTLSFLSLVNCGTLFLPLYFLLLPSSLFEGYLMPRDILLPLSLPPRPSLRTCAHPSLPFPPINIILPPLFYPPHERERHAHTHTFYLLVVEGRKEEKEAYL